MSEISFFRNKKNLVITTTTSIALIVIIITAVTISNFPGSGPSGNRIPIITGFNPALIVSFDEFEAQLFQINASDPDGDELNYEWRLNGVLVKEDAANYTFTPEYFASGIYELNVTVFDGSDEITLLWTITVNNVFEILEINPTGDGIHENLEESSIFYNDILYFSAQNETDNYELWRTNGTIAGTYMVKDINPTGSSNPLCFTEFNNLLYFRAQNETDNYELWRTDGSEEGTFMAVEINPTGDSQILHITKYNNKLYFRAQYRASDEELWCSDGTIQGTYMLKDINVDVGGSFPYSFVEMNGILYFVADDFPTYGFELWRTNGTEAGTYMVKDIHPTGYSYPDFLTEYNGNLYFKACNQSGNDEIWRSNGTDTGTYMVKDINPTGSSSPYDFTELDGILYFRAQNQSNNQELWRTDGTEPGTFMVRDINPSGSANLNKIVELSNAIYFGAKNESNMLGLWRSDGTTIGTSLIKKFNLTDEASIQHSTELNNQIYFTIELDEELANQTLWCSDGTNIGTFEFKSFDPPSGEVTIHDIITLNGYLLVSVTYPARGTELWIY